MSTARSILKTFQDVIYVERFSASKGLLQRIDPRVKLCCTAAFVLAAVAVSTIFPLAILLAFLVVLCVMSQIPLKFFFGRAVLVPVLAGIIALPLPFITPGTALVRIGYDGTLISMTAEGLYKAVQFTARIFVCVASLILLVLTTRFSKLLHAMERLKLPTLLVVMTSVTFRFIFLFLNEAYRMVLAKESRTVAKESWKEALRSLGNMISTLFIRAHERGERVYLGMLARGYSGTTKSIERLGITPPDCVFAAAFLAVCSVAIWIEQWFVVG